MRKSYEDIIDLPYHKSSKHPHMSRQKRAAQFSPFAALTGHDSAVQEAARTTAKRVELDEYMKADLNERLAIIKENINEGPEVSIVYFREDHLKAGGSYLTARGYVQKINEYEELLVMQNGEKISINDIVEIDSELFNGLGY